MSPRPIGLKKEEKTYSCFQQALENGTSFVIGKRKTTKLSKTQLQRIFCHLTVRKAILNHDFQKIETVKVDLKVIYIISTPKTVKLKNLIASRLKEKFTDDATKDKFLKDETIKKSRRPFKMEQEIKKSTNSQAIKHRKCYVCLLSAEKNVNVYDNSIRRHLSKVHPSLCKLTKYDIQNICPLVKIEL